jgi:outer membrane protein assembly factor BamA
VVTLLKKTLLITVLCCTVHPIFFASNNAKIQEIMLFGDERDVPALNRHIEQDFVLKDLKLITHGLIASDEAKELLGLTPGTVTTVASLARGIAHVMKKNKFSAIRLLRENTADEKKLTFDFVGLLILRSVSLTGIVFGKELYKNYYVLEQGDIFDIKKHHHSLARIQEALRSSGYLEATVISELSYNQENTLVDVTIEIAQKSLYGIGTIQVALPHTTTDKELLEQEAHHVLARALSKNRYTRGSINKAAHQLRKYLTKKGFYGITIELEETINPHKKQVTIKLLVEIAGKKEFIFFGNTFFSHDQLQEIVASGGSSIATIPINMIVQELIKAYQTKGFWQVDIETQEEPSRCRILINEGTRASIEQVEFNGITDEGKQSYIVDLVVERYPELEQIGPCAAYRKELRLRTSIPLDNRCLEEQRRWLLDYLHRKGHLEAQVDLEMQGEPEALVVVWQLHPGPIAYFGKTIVQGLPGISYNNILRELPYRQGMVWDPKKLQESFLALRNLGIFEVVHIYADHPDTADDLNQERAIIIKLTQQDPFELRMRAGFGLQQVGKNFPLGRGITYKIGATFLCINPGGVADQLLFDVDLARSHQSIQGEYRLPWLLTMPIRGSIKGYSTSYDQPGFSGIHENLYRVKRQGFLGGIARCKQHVETTMNLGVEWLQTIISPDQYSLAATIGKAINFDASLFAVKIPYIIFESTLLFDGVDNRLSPTCGLFTMISGKAMIPVHHAMRTAYVIRIQAEQSLFIPVTPRIVVGARVRIGHIFYEQFNMIMPVERFYLGGANSVRSYNTDLCPPLATLHDEQGMLYSIPQGGTRMINANIEIRYAWSRWIEMVVFQDIGYLHNCAAWQFDGNGFVAGTGFGIRYRSPFGPLRCDVGWKWKTNTSIEQRYAWFLRLGQAF